MDDKLRDKGSKLFVCMGNPETVIPTLVKVNKAGFLTYERQTEPHNVARDRKIKDALQNESVEVSRKSISWYIFVNSLLGFAVFIQKSYLPLSSVVFDTVSKNVPFTIRALPLLCRSRQYWVTLSSTQTIC